MSDRICFSRTARYLLNSSDEDGGLIVGNDNVFCFGAGLIGLEIFVESFEGIEGPVLNRHKNPFGWMRRPLRASCELESQGSVHHLSDNHDSARWIPSGRRADRHNFLPVEFRFQNLL